MILEARAARIERSSWSNTVTIVVIVQVFSHVGNKDLEAERLDRKHSWNNCVTVVVTVQVAGHVDDKDLDSKSGSYGQLFP